MCLLVFFLLTSQIQKAKSIPAQWPETSIREMAADGFCSPLHHWWVAEKVSKADYVQVTFVSLKPGSHSGNDTVIFIVGKSDSDFRKYATLQLGEQPTFHCRVHARLGASGTVFISPSGQDIFNWLIMDKASPQK